MEDFMCNVLILGKSGTGKSSLLNYLCDSDLAKTGTGRPVTKEGIYEYVVKIKGQDIKIFDSYGIEPGKVDRWNEVIRKAKLEHGVQCSIADWFHSVIYCIQAGGGRVEDIDVGIIRNFLDEGNRVTIVLTKADQVDEDDEKKMCETIIRGIPIDRRDGIKVIPTCVGANKRSGYEPPFGRDEVCEAILNGWKDTVLQRLPKHVIARIEECVKFRLNAIKENSMTKVQGLSMNNEDLYDKINNDVQNFESELKNEIIPNILKESARMCHKADMQLSAVFKHHDTTEIVQKYDSSTLPTAPGRNYSWGKFALDTVTTVAFGLIGLGLKKGIGFLIGRRKERKYQEQLAEQNSNPDNIAQQRQELSNVIDEKVLSICEEYKSQENILARELAKAINSK